MKSLKLKQIAEYLDAELVGNGEEDITGMNGILEAVRGDITFLAHIKYTDTLPLCQASAVIVEI